MSTRDVMQQALDALEMQIHGAGSIIHSKMAWDALHAELAKPEHAPVAWVGPARHTLFDAEFQSMAKMLPGDARLFTPLYRKEDVL